jgi:CDP-diglyceride synthetase
MNKTLLTILMLALLLLFIISPFAALTSLMLLVFVSAFFSLLGNLFKAIIGRDTDPKRS